MAKHDNTYQNSKCGINRDSEFFMDDDAEFNFYGTKVTGAELKAQLVYGADVLAYDVRASVVLSANFGVNIPNTQKYVTIVMTSTLVTGSAYLTSGPIKGQELFIKLIAGTTASGNILFSMSGVSLVTWMGTDNSRFIMYNSTNSQAMIHLVCTSDGCWSVMDISSPAAVTFT